MNAEDVLKAVEEIDFPEFSEPLKIALEEFRRDNAVKKLEAKEKGQVRKRKSDGDAEENGKSAEALVSEVYYNIGVDKEGCRDVVDVQESEAQQSE